MGYMGYMGYVGYVGYMGYTGSHLSLPLCAGGPVPIGHRGA